VWQNYSADSVKDNYGTRIDGQDSDSWTTRSIWTATTPSSS
ncbi:autotransporter outer membrane beta-barrel domain-containing protein, partial [Salmonella enterica subsp. enterica]|nr:autotransporter outer membrane beta-barrel domain-containing protein [Salmonella enterica subsp. enterica]